MVAFRSSFICVIVQLISFRSTLVVQDEFNLSRLQREIFVGCINFWAMFGALFAQYFSDGYGRRFTFIAAAVGFILGIFVMVVSNSYQILLVGRAFVGLGLGVGLAVDPMYIAEISPAQHRGKLVTYSEIAINVGIVLGFSSGLFLAPLENGREWRVMFLMGAIMPMIMIPLVLIVMPESPRWLVSKGRTDESKGVLQNVYPPDFDVDSVVADIQEAIEREKEAEHAFGWGIVLHPTPAFRRMLMVGVGTAVAQQAVGIDAIQYYLLDVIEDAHVASSRGESLILIFLGLVKLFFISVGGRLFDRRGRRPLLFVSLIGMSVATLFISISFFVNSNHRGGATIFGLAVYLAFFSIGMGPGAWLIPSEVFSTSIRGKAMSVATFSNRATATLMSSTFLSTSNALGWGGFFLMLSAICLIVLGFLYKYLPETKGRSLEDMSVYFAELTGDTSVLEAEERLRRGDKGSLEMPGRLVPAIEDSEMI